VILLVVGCILGALLYRSYIGSKEKLEECEARVATIEKELEQLRQKNLELSLALEEGARWDEAERRWAPGIRREYERELEERWRGCEERAHELEERVNILESWRKSHETDLEKLSSSLGREVSDLRSRLEAKEGEVSLLSRRLHEAEKEAEVLRKGLQICNAEKAQRKEELTRLQRERFEMERMVDEAKKAYEQLKEELKEELQKKEATLVIFKEKVSISLVDRILFPFGRSTLTPQGRERLKKLCKALSSISGREIQVVGHTDPRPIKEEFLSKFPSNWELSTGRASTVVRFLESECGVDPRFLKAAGRAFYEPIASNETEEGRAQNRRVEIIIGPRMADLPLAGAR